jgi:molybdopterin synthase sulfur carrier subunit
MQITVRFFASLRDATGTQTCALDVPDGSSLAQAVEHLVARYPALDGYQSSWHFAINQIHAEPHETLHPGDTLAIFPYVAGG